MVSVTVIINLLLIACVLEANALWRKGIFWPENGLPLEELNNLTLVKFNGSSDIGCARRCTRYPGCTPFSLAPGLCTLMTAQHSVRREQRGVDFYIVNEVVQTCNQESGTDGGDPFNLSSAYYASYHQITRIRLCYDGNRKYPKGLEVQHGSDVAHAGYLNGPLYECLLMNNEFIQQWKYSIHMYADDIPVFGCITLITTHKTCGPYGNACGTISTLEGYHLLCIAGRSGLAFDCLALVFDSC